MLGICFQFPKCVQSKWKQMHIFNNPPTSHIHINIQIFPASVVVRPSIWGFFFLSHSCFLHSFCNIQFLRREPNQFHCFWPRAIAQWCLINMRLVFRLRIPLWCDKCVWLRFSNNLKLFYYSYISYKVPTKLNREGYHNMNFIVTMWFRLHWRHFLSYSTFYRFFFILGFIFSHGNINDRPKLCISHAHANESFYISI